MSLKFIKNFFIIAVLLSIIYISGCVDEPNIDPIKRPFSITRIGNFGYNVASINVTIYKPDSSTIIYDNLAVNSLTDYFEMPSGKRRVVVVNSANNQVLIDKQIEFTSYEESSLFFTGYFSTKTLENTYTYVLNGEGDTYLEESPTANQAIMKWLNLSGDSKDSTAKKYIVHVKLINQGSTKKDSASLFSTIGSISYAYGSLEFGKIKSTSNVVLRGYKDTLTINGNVYFSLVNAAGKHNDTLATCSTSIQAGYFYYFYVTGEPKDKTTIKIFEQKQLPLAARPK
jgi:hypothetical protein